jgi:hypothetical protein
MGLGGRYGAVAAALAVAGLLFTGCGGSSDSEDQRPLSKAAYVKQANQICKKGLEEKDLAVSTGLKAIPRSEFPTLSDQRLTELSEGIFPAYRKMTARLSSLSPPVNDRATVKKIVKRFEALMKKVEADPILMVEGSPFHPAGIAAEAYGLDDCTF